MNILTKLNQELDKITNAAMTPAVDALLKKIEKEVRDQPPNPLKNIEAQLRELKKINPVLRDSLVRCLTNYDSRHMMADAFALIERNIDRIAGGDQILKDMEAKGRDQLDLLSQSAEPSAFPTNESPQTLQQVAGLSDQSYENIYHYALQRYEERDGLEDSYLLLSLLTELNPYYFEPWLYSGICLLEKQKFEAALHAFSMATMTKYEQPLPHLYAAQCYLALGKVVLAKEMLEVGLKLCSKVDKSNYGEMIQSLNSLL